MSNSLKRIGYFRNKNNYVEAPTIPSPIFNITESANATAVTYTIDTNKANATLYFATGAGATANDFTDNTLTGNITLDANGNASLVRSVSSNNIGLSRFFSTTFRTNAVTGNIIYTGNTYNIIDNVPVTTGSLLPSGPNLSPNDLNDGSNVVMANLTVDGNEVTQIQLMKNVLYYSSNLDVYNITLTPGSGPDSNVDVLVIGAGGPGGFAYSNATHSFNRSGGGGGGGGEVVQTSLVFDSGSNANLSISLPSSTLIPTSSNVGDPANANTIISGLNLMSSSNPANIIAIHGEPGLNGNATSGGDGGNGGGPGPSSTNSKRGAGGAGGKAVSPATSFGAGGDFGGGAGGPGANARDIYSQFRETFIAKSINNSFQGLVQSSTTGSGSGAIFNLISIGQLSEYRQPTNTRNRTNSYIHPVYAGLDSSNQAWGRIEIDGAAEIPSQGLGQCGAGYAIGDQITLLAGTPYETVVEVRNIETTAGPGHQVGSIIWGYRSSLSLELGLRYISGISPDVIINTDPIGYAGIGPPYAFMQSTPSDETTRRSMFGGGGGVSDTNLNGGISPSGVGVLGGGGKGEHFRNTGSNIDMFATGGAGGAVILSWKRFAPYRSIQIT